MLLGEDFGRCHDARLITIVEGDEHSHQRHKGLAGAYVALEQTVHLPAGTHVVTYLVHNSFLRTGKTEGEVMRIEVVKQLADMLEYIAAILATMVGSIAENVELNVEQLFKLQTVTRRLHLLRCLGIMYAAHRLIARDEVKGFGDEGGEGFGQRILQLEKHVLDRLLYHSRRDAHLLHALRGGVVRLHAHFGELKVGGSLHLGMSKLETSLIDGRATEDYELLLGWQTIDGKEYYFDSKGIAATGELKLGLEKCKFSESGELLSKEKTEIDSGKPMVALTFDDGPGPRTSEILDQLKKYNAHATFFMLGKNVKSYPDAIKQMLKDGNELGNHSYDHQQLTKIDAEAIAKEVNDTNENIKNICGSPATVLRPPYGAINDTVKSSVGMPMILWNVDTLDWKTRNTQSTIDEVMRNLKDGDIILMHDIHTQTVDAALQLIPKLEEEGYQLVTVSEMAAAKNKTLENGTAYSDFISTSKK